MSIKNLIITIFVGGAVVGGVLYLRHINSFVDPQISFKPQQEKLYKVEASSAEPLNIMSETLPKFAVDLNKEEFSNVWQADAAAQKEIVYTEVIGSVRNTPLEVKTQIDPETKQVYVTPQTENKFKPGLYKLNVTIKTVHAKEVTITQDFTWGVLAVNTNKATYQVGEEVKIGMGVLDDYGDTKCIAKGVVRYETAKVWLVITSPSGKETNFSTDDGSIVGSKECGPKTVTNTADFQTEMTADEVGKYKIHMEAENINGKRSLDDYFAVASSPQPFDIERTSYPTRIYPKEVYPITMTVKANQDYSGPVTDIVPDNFGISEISDGGRTIKEDKYLKIVWNVNWKAGETYTLKYTILFPQISPEFYILGPLTIGEYSEERNWQIASDALWTLIQETHNALPTVNTITGTFASTPGRGHLIVAICFRTTGSVNGTGFLFPPQGGNTMGIQSPGGYSGPAENNANSTTLGSIYIFYKIAGTSESTAVVCEKTEANIENEPMGVQLLEFSGGSSSITLDTAGGSHSNVDQTTGCNGGSFQSATNSITPSLANALIVSAFYATAASKTFNSHTNSFVDTDINGVPPNGFFHATNGSYDSGYLELPTPAARTDTITLNAAGGACANVIVTFNNGYNFIQGSHRFFDESNAAVPPTALGVAQNTPVTLLHRRFRLRILLDQGSPVGTTLPIGGGKFKLQYATLPGGGNCASQTYNDVTTNSTVAFSDVPGIATGANISASGSDPSDSGGGITTVLENFYDDPNIGGTPPSISNLQNTIPLGSGGLWDFSLVDNTSVTNTPVTYCLRIIDGYTNAALAFYSSYPTFTGVTNAVNFIGGSRVTGGTIVR